MVDKPEESLLQEEQNWAWSARWIYVLRTDMEEAKRDIRMHTERLRRVEYLLETLERRVGTLERHVVNAIAPRKRRAPKKRRQSSKRKVLR